MGELTIPSGMTGCGSGGDVIRRERRRDIGIGHAGRATGVDFKALFGTTTSTAQYKTRHFKRRDGEPLDGLEADHIASRSSLTHAADFLPTRRLFFPFLASVLSYLPGCIVRIAMKQFLTYDYTEFFPGPHLNMIVVREISV